ncbi:MAG TPA: hypothetical protein VF794_12665 [Archangium sp.]|jgi:hypothetical protein|uniref:hypothetical protein n=1 Tax=Archangium sp. TaxID=1872627 RepID=UPI002ED7D1FE
MDPSREVIEPRPEAMPLEFDALTEEQRSAGKNATRLLRGMTQQSWKPAPRQSPAHSYLPVIYKEAHHNRVILLDGERGSGKSALLVTLLDAYGRALTEQRLPPKYDAWITPADRIIPVGLIDLQPLPASTHLLFHLVASLERVVEAMETRREHSKQATAAWHPEEGNESRSRQTWRRFARVAASGWEDNLEARKGKLDPEAFAVEVEQGELQRLDVTQTFREFMDALVDDYQAWSHWQSDPPPLFLLAIDDADMNPELSVHLLELVRKLRHPRLAFLLTGDTDLFIKRLTAPPPPSQPSRPGFIPIRPPAELDVQQRQQLGMDLYAKAIPLKHRCRLKELEPNQRLVKGPEIARILERIRVPTQQLPPGRPSGSLLDYFGRDSQILEALPGRLRALGELADSLRPLTTEAEAANAKNASSQTVERIWQFALRTEPGASRLESMVRVDATTGRLRIEDGFVVDWEVEARAAMETGHAHLSFELPLRAVVFRNQARDSELGAQPTAALLLAASVIADSGTSLGRTPLAPGSMARSLLAHATLRSFVVGPRTYVWPLPDWDSFLDIDLLRTDWKLALVLLESPSPDVHFAERMAKAFLRTVLNVGLGAPVDAGKPDQEDSLSWTALATRLKLAATLKKGEQHSARRRALAQWAHDRAGLLAAPESGLPASVANALLQALRATFKDTSWQRVRRALLDARRERLAWSFQAERRQAADAGTLDNIIHALDQQFLTHQFRHSVEHVKGDTSEQERVFSHLQTVLQNIHLPFLDSRIGPRSPGNTLATYLTPLRLTWLRKAPTPMLQHIRNELDSFQQISDAGTLALTRFWKAAHEEAGASDVANALQSTPDGLTIAEPYRRLLDQKTAQKTATGTPSLVFVPREDLALSLHSPRGTLSPFIDSKSASKAANRVLDVVIRMAYDHEKDWSRLLGDSTVPVGWKGVELRFQGSEPFHPWPVPRWPTLFEWESLEQSWVDALKLAKEAIAANDPLPDIRIVDALAFWMLSVCQDMQRRRPSLLELKLNPSADDWFTLIVPQNKEFRGLLYEGWRLRLPLMAAPESGLSQNAAATILNGVFREGIRPAIQNDFSRSAHTLRHTRMIDAGIPTEHVDSLLSRIDRANPDHPWVKKFGVWKSTEGTSSP